MKNAQQKVYILCIYSTSVHFLRFFRVILRRGMLPESRMKAERKESVCTNISRDSKSRDIYKVYIG